MDLFGLPLSIDPAATVLAVIALVIAIQIYRATTFHRARVVEVNHSWSQDVHGTALQFDIVVRNTGLSINEARFYLAFNLNNDNGGTSRVRIQLGKQLREGFEHGVQARFETVMRLPISERERVTAKWLQCFSRQTPRQTQPRLVIMSNEFEVVSIPLVSRFDALLAVWNRLAFRLNSKFDRHGKYKDGTEWVKLGDVLPILGLRAWFRLQCLSEGVSRDLRESLGASAEKVPSTS